VPFRRNVTVVVEAGAESKITASVTAAPRLVEVQMRAGAVCAIAWKNQGKRAFICKVDGFTPSSAYNPRPIETDRYGMVGAREVL
jgi:hypothetical protein